MRDPAYGELQKAGMAECKAHSCQTQWQGPEGRATAEAPPTQAARRVLAPGALAREDERSRGVQANPADWGVLRGKREGKGRERSERRVPRDRVLLPHPRLLVSKFEWFAPVEACAVPPDSERGGTAGARPHMPSLTSLLLVLAAERSTMVLLNAVMAVAPRLLSPSTSIVPQAPPGAQETGAFAEVGCTPENKGARCDLTRWGSALALVRREQHEQLAEQTQQPGPKVP